jgi:hypothetical protein
MNKDPIPKNLIAVHDLLTETIAIAQDNGVGFGYGMAFFPRTGRFDAPVFGVVTRGGESTTLPIGCCTPCSARRFTFREGSPPRCGME